MIDNERVLYEKSMHKKAVDYFIHVTLPLPPTPPSPNVNHLLY